MAGVKAMAIAARWGLGLLRQCVPDVVVDTCKRFGCQASWLLYAGMVNGTPLPPGENGGRADDGLARLVSK